MSTPTGITGHYTFYVVDTKPYIMVNGTRYNSGSTVYKNGDSFVSFYDDSDITNSGDTGVTITSEGNIIIDESFKYSETRGKTLSTAEGTEAELKGLNPLDDTHKKIKKKLAELFHKMPKGKLGYGHKSIPY